MYSSHVYPYHKSMSSTFIKPTYSSHSFVFVNPKMNYTKVNSKPTTKATATSLASSSTFLCRKHPTVNRTVINNHKNKLTSKTDSLTNGVKTSTVVATTSSQLSKSSSSRMENRTSKEKDIKKFNTLIEPRTLISCTQQPKSSIGVHKVTHSAAAYSKSVSEKPVLINQMNSVSPATRTCTTSSTPKMSLTRSYFPKSKNITLKVSPITNTTSTSRFVERHRYKIVREHKPVARKSVASTMSLESSVTPVKPHTINTRFNLVKKPDVFTHKSGYSYVSKRCLQRAKVISLSNSEAGKSYIKKLGKLLIDAGKKFDKKPLVMMSKRKISRGKYQVILK